MPTARNLTAAKGVRALIYSVPKNDPDIMYVGLNDRDKAWHDLYRVRISTGERTLMRQNTERIAGWVFDLDGKLAPGPRSADNGDTEILRVDDDGFTKIYTCNVFENVRPVPLPQGRQARLHGDEQGRSRPDAPRAVRSVQTGKEELVESDPLASVDFGGAIFSEKTDELVGTTYVDDKTRLYFKDKAFEADYALLKQKLPGKEVGIALRRPPTTGCSSCRPASDIEPGDDATSSTAKTKKL